MLVAKYCMKKNKNISSLNKTIEERIDEKAAILEQIVLPDNTNDIRVFIKREDLLHPTLSGNKWRKLKYNLKRSYNETSTY